METYTQTATKANPTYLQKEKEKILLASFLNDIP